MFDSSLKLAKLERGLTIPTFLTKYKYHAVIHADAIMIDDTKFQILGCVRLLCSIWNFYSQGSLCEAVKEYSIAVKMIAFMSLNSPISE